MRAHPVENPTCAAFEECKEVLDTVPLDLSEDYVKWVTSKLSGAAGTLRAEEIDPRNWLLCFGCASEEFRFFVANLEDWMDTPSPLGCLPCSDGMLTCCTG